MKVHISKLIFRNEYVLKGILELLMRCDNFSTDFLFQMGVYLSALEALKQLSGVHFDIKPCDFVTHTISYFKCAVTI